MGKGELELSPAGCGVLKLELYPYVVTGEYVQHGTVSITRDLAISNGPWELACRYLNGQLFAVDRLHGRLSLVELTSIPPGYEGIKLIRI